MCKAKRSRDELLKILKRDKKMSFQEIWEFESNPDIDFGPGVDAFDVLFANSDLGKLIISFEEQEVRMPENQAMSLSPS